MGSGALIPGDAERIAAFLGMTEQKLKEKHLEEIEKFNTTLFRPKIERRGKPYGTCTFFRQGKCQIHAVKPFECKLAMPCQPHGPELIAWFDTNFFLNPKDPESIRQYATYLKSGGLQLADAAMTDLVPNAVQRAKILSYEVLK